MSARPVSDFPYFDCRVSVFIVGPDDGGRTKGNAEVHQHGQVKCTFNVVRRASRDTVRRDLETEYIAWIDEDRAAPRC